ncbi:ABC transporter ATP-binding protein [Streptomyces sulfonofaciens]|uniref:ABC transporter ATP-binding protein n=1 Tax=Streptomyces sulfonofaciens TaxID=68272 RepID=A0A919GMC5_9ACTN|nr:ATP-binding cassette domain-containing protein [Streptomyces sulfonofaciens]GHH86566.1 ABC transporter ATP-binding protein [Streptomyces sulfonofaciens]
MVAPPDNDVLKAHALTVAYHGSPALAEVSLAVRDGEVLAVSGPRGSGKTTLLRCLSGQLVPDRGEVWFRTTGVHTLGRPARERLRRERFGWVGPRHDLVPELTAWENAALPLLLSGIAHRTARAAALEWLGHLDVASCARRRPASLTQAQRQRVAVARALVAGPSVLFADEPTAPLHHSDHDHVLRTLMTAARARGITVVLATSDQETAALADRAVALLDGRAADAVPHGAGAEGEAACSLSV